MHVKIESADDLRIEHFVWRNQPDWTHSCTRGFMVVYRDTGRGLHLNSYGELVSPNNIEPRSMVDLLLDEIASPQGWVVSQIERIPGVFRVWTTAERPDVIYVETFHQDGRDWSTVVPAVTRLLLEFYGPRPKRQSFWQWLRNRRRATAPSH